MMSFLALAKKKISLAIFSSSKIPRFLSSSFTDLKTPQFKINDYLVSTLDFSAAKAATISKRLTHLKSDDKPESVRHFLEHHGFDESQIRTIISGRPNILCSSAENTLSPALSALRELGLSTSALNQIILSNPQALWHSEAAARIKFWRDFVGGEEEALVMVFQRNRGLICHDINTGIANKISILRSHEISDKALRMIVCTSTHFITSSFSTMDDTLKRVKALGFQPESSLFAKALQTPAFHSEEAFQKKMNIFKGFGFSEEEFLSALHKNPTMVSLTKECLRTKMDFLLGEVRCDIPYISSRPVLLSLSLEKRLRPRHQVLRLLESKHVLKRVSNFWNATTLIENKFVAKYILPYKEEIPELHQLYLTACSPGMDKPFSEIGGEHPC